MSKTSDVKEMRTSAVDVILKQYRHAGAGEAKSAGKNRPRAHMY
jgi:hypothetical protein